MSKHLCPIHKARSDTSSGNVSPRIRLIAMALVMLWSLLGYSPTHVMAAGATYYVDKTVPCSDSGPGTLANPFCTIARGAAMARNPGDTVNVLHGSYAETVYLTSYSGTAGNPITFHAEPGVTMTGMSPTGFGTSFAISGRSYIVIDGFTIARTPYKGIYVDGSNHITISNNKVSYAGVTSLNHPYEQGIYLRNTSYSTVTGNTTDHNTCIGIRVVGGDHNLISNNVSYSNYSLVETDAAGIELTGSSDNTVINNITYSNEDSGINVYIWDTTVDVQSTYNLIIGNLSYENGDHGIDANNSPYNTFIGNTVHGNGTVGINVEGEATTGSHHATIINNISVGNGFTPPSISFGGNLRVDLASVNGTVMDYNLVYRQNASVQIIWNNVNYTSLAAFKAAVPSQMVHGLEGDPLFVDPVPSALRQEGVPYMGAGLIGDYHLMAGSPAIDSADSDAPSEPTTDLEGNARVDDPATLNTGAGTRTYDDRGVFEFQPSTTGCYPLTINHTGQGNDPIASPTNSTGCEAGTYIAGASITLSGGSPATGWQIVGWAGTDLDSSTAAGNTVTMPARTHTVQIHYLQIEYNLTINVVGSGSVTKIPSQTTYHYGDTLQLSGIPSTDWNFDHWSGDLTGTTNPASITVDGDKTVTATFILANRAPTDIALSNASIRENEAAGTSIGVLSTTDPDAGDVFTYSFCGGADDASFQINGSNLQSAAIFDYETRNSYEICIRSTDDGGLSTTKDFTISIINVDDTVPTLISSVRVNPNPTNQATVQFLVTFSESVTGGTTANFVLSTTGAISGASITGISAGPAATRTITVDTGSGNGTIRVDMLTSTGVADVDGNAVSNVPYTSGQAYTVDKTRPSIEINQAATQADPTNIAPVYFTVVFSEAVSGFDGTNVALSGTAGATGAVVTEVSPKDGTTYSVAVSGMTGDGTVIASVPAGTVLDAAKNTNTASNSTDNEVTYNAGAPDTVIDSNPPAVTSSGEAAFTFSSPDSDLAGFECKLDDHAYSACTSPYNLSGLAAGSHTFVVRAIDQAGNADPLPASHTWIVDLGYPVVSASKPANGATIQEGVTKLEVNFNEDVRHDGSNNAADSKANYLLVEDGADNVFNTLSCTGGLIADDVSVTINSVTYTNNGGRGPFVALLNIDPLSVGSYRLLICGTTSIQDLVDNKLNNGLSDAKVDFLVRTEAVKNSNRNKPTVSNALPATGFPQGQVTILPQQPASQVYASTDLWLEIPRLGVKMTIVGVPQASNGWDVSWLGEDVGWLNGSAFPTWNGNSVLTGHVWDAFNQPGPFVRLKDLRYGDVIKIHAFGQIFLYEVRENQTVSPADTSTVFRHEEKSWLTLVTCEDYRETSQTYTSRRMVRAVLVSVTAEK